MKIVLAAMLWVLLVAKTVHGAEAPNAPRPDFPWVLWAEYRDMLRDVKKPIRTEEGFFIVDALESKKECLAFRELEIARRIQQETPESGATGVQRRGRLGNILLWDTGDQSAQNTIHSLTYLCYPVGLEPGWRLKKEWNEPTSPPVDPRGPKGK